MPAIPSKVHDPDKGLNDLRSWSKQAEPRPFAAENVDSMWAEQESQTPDSITIIAKDFSNAKCFKLIRRIVSSPDYKKGVALKQGETEATLKNAKRLLKNHGYEEVAESLDWNGGRPTTHLPVGRAVIKD